MAAPFYTNVSEPVDALVTDLPLPSGEDVPQTNIIVPVVIQQSSQVSYSSNANCDHGTDTNNRSYDDDEDFRRSDNSPLLPNSPQDSDDECMVSADNVNNRNQRENLSHTEKRARIIVFITGLIFLMVTFFLFIWLLYCTRIF